MSDEALISELLERWAHAVSTRNMDGVLAHHTPDIVMFDVPPPVQLRGLEAYQKSFEEFFGYLGEAGTFELRELAVTASDGVAFCHGLISCIGSGRPELTLRLTVGLRKIDGQWVIAHEHHSEPSA